MAIRFLSSVLFLAAGAAQGVSVREFGAVGDGRAMDTSAIQKAIDACDAQGGTVHFPPGTYFSGSLHLRSGVNLFLDAGATLLGSREKKDYDPYEKLDFKNDADHETSFFRYALLWGEDLERIGISGSGTIDANHVHRGGPKPIAFKRCKFVTIQGIRIVNAPNYAISLLGTDYVNIDGVAILNAYCDGIDPDSCQHVRISNCNIESVDDAIVPKTSFSLGERRACEDIVVTNCYLATECNCFKLGTESGGDFRRIAVSNCVMTGLDAFNPATSGISLESVDGAHIDGVVVSNVAMNDVESPIFVRLGNRGRDMDTPVPGTLENVSISNIVATGATMNCAIAGIPDRNVRGVTLSDVRIRYSGGDPYLSADASVPENEDKYPTAGMFGPLPGYGLYCRHVDDLTLRNVQLLFEEKFWRRSEDEKRKDGPPKAPQRGRPGHALVCDGVSNLHIDHLAEGACPDGEAAIRFTNVTDATIADCVAAEGAKVFLEVAGQGSGGIVLLTNDLRKAEREFVLRADAPQDAISSAAKIGR